MTNLISTMFHISVPHVHETSPGKNTIFLSIYLPHLRRLNPSSYWTSACVAALSIQSSPDVISVRQIRDLPLASFRFLVAEDTLALSYTLPTTRACSGLTPVRLFPCWAHNSKPAIRIDGGFFNNYVGKFNTIL